MRGKVERFERISFPENPGLVGNSLRKKKIFKGQCKFSNKFHSSPRDHPYNTSAKGLGGWGRKMAIFDDVQYCIYVDIGGFQLEFVSISRVINHMTCALIG